MRRFGDQPQQATGLWPADDASVIRLTTLERGDKLRIYKAFRGISGLGVSGAFPLCKPWRLCYTRAAREDLFRIVPR
jgi:hypothetical protein